MLVVELGQLGGAVVQHLDVLAVALLEYFPRPEIARIHTVGGLESTGGGYQAGVIESQSNEAGADLLERPL